MKATVTLLALVAYVMANPIQEEMSFSQIDWSEFMSINVKPGGANLPSGRVIGGDVIDIQSVPYQGYVIAGGERFCGCSIISPLWFLSAAQCVYDAHNIQVVVGAQTLDQEADSQVVLHQVGYFYHPHYNFNSEFSNDIALLKSKIQITFNNAIQAINLPPSNPWSYVGSTAYLSGWGRASHDALAPTVSELHGISLTVISNDVCAKSYRQVLDTNICTAGTQNDVNVGACDGDSGGPLVVDNVQVGIVSFGPVTCNNGGPIVYTRVSSYREWILEISEL